MSDTPTSSDTFAWPIAEADYRRGLADELDAAQRAGRDDRAAEIQAVIDSLPGNSEDDDSGSPRGRGRRGRQS